MNSKPAARTSSSVALAVTLALGQLAFGDVAQARAVDEWGYWNASTSAGPDSGGIDGFGNFIVYNTNTTQNNNNQQFDGDQRIFGVNPSFLVAPDVQGGYVGYTLCYNSCNGGNLPTTAGTINLEVTQGAERVANHQHNVGEVYSWSNGQPFYVQDVRYYDGKLVATGTFEGAAFSINDGAASLQNDTTTYYWGTTYNNTYLKSRTDSAVVSANLSNGYNGVESPVRWANLYINDGSGVARFGKPIAAAQIAEQLRLGQTYNFYGRSYMGSDVQIAVNFQNATWNGTWSQSYINDSYNSVTGQKAIAQNGFTAAGGISGSALASNSVTGVGATGVGFVTGGTVDATLVGMISGTDASAAGVIGRSIVTVQQAVGTATVADIFQAQANGFDR